MALTAAMIGALAWAIGNVLQVIQTADSTSASIIAKERIARIQRQANALQKAMAKDNALMTQLMDAYQRRDTRLANDIITSSPFGSRFNAISKESEALKSKISELQDTQVAKAQEQANIDAKISNAYAKSQTTGSVIGDLISGGIKSRGDLNNTSYTPSGVTRDQIKEVNNGQTK